MIFLTGDTHGDVDYKHWFFGHYHFDRKFQIKKHVYTTA